MPKARRPRGKSRVTVTVSEADTVPVAIEESPRAQNFAAAAKKAGGAGGTPPPPVSQAHIACQWWEASDGHLLPLVLGFSNGKTAMRSRQVSKTWHATGPAKTQ